MLTSGLWLLVSVSCNEPSSYAVGPSPYNLGFEQHDNDGSPYSGYAGGARHFDDYSGTLDNTTAHGGKYSLRLSYVIDTTGNDFGVATSQLPIAQAVRGRRVRFSGWIKTKDVSEYASLWWRADDVDSSTIAFNDMYAQAINGTREWRQYSFELPVPANAAFVYFGVLLAGTGDAWFDDLAIDTNGVAFLR
jgi:hypothetical protein